MARSGPPVAFEGERNWLFAKWQVPNEFHFVASLLHTWNGNLLQSASAQVVSALGLVFKTSNVPLNVAFNWDAGKPV